MEPKQRAYLELHIAVLLFGFTAILGKLITISAVSLIWWRVAISVVSFLFIIRIPKLLREVSPKSILRFLGIGVIVCLHWVAFYGSIKISNASVALVCIATTAFFTSLVEPIILKKRIDRYELLLGLLILPAMMLIVQGVDFSYRWGIALGILSALLATIFSILNKKYIDEASPMQISALELLSVLIVLSLILPFMPYIQDDFSWIPQGNDWFHLIVLALVCTTFAYVLSMQALTKLTAFASNLVYNLEPVYGIVLAIIILKEHKELELSFYLGVLLICLSVFSYPWIKKRTAKT